jgi:OTU-like cysteine protease
MPPNSISLQFNKMPTVTVDGKTQKFKAEKVDGGYQPITEGGVTYSLVKDKASGRYTMNITGEPAALEKYNFTVGKGRVTDGKFGGDSMENFFKGSVSVGEKKNADKDYFQNFSIAGGHLADRTAFLQSGAWGLDQSSAEKELNRLEEEAEAAAKKADTKPETAGKPLVAQPMKEKIDGPNSSEDPTVIVTSNKPLNENEVAMLKAGLNESVYNSIDILSKAQDNSTLREAFAALKLDNTAKAQQMLNDKAKTFLKNDLSFGEKAKLTEANLTKLGLKAKQTKGDGNCFFHAVADQLGGGQGVVRTKVALAMNDIMTRPKHVRLPQGLDNEPTEESRDKTLLDATIAGDKAWGEDYHCAYVARAFDRPVVLIAPNNIRIYEKDKQTRTITNASQLPKNAILLSHKGGNHWESALLINPSRK